MDEIYTLPPHERDKLQFTSFLNTFAVIQKVELEALKADNKRLTEALEWYANQTHCKIHDKNVARAALGEK